MELRMRRYSGREKDLMDERKKEWIDIQIARRIDKDRDREKEQLDRDEKKIDKGREMKMER